VVSIGKLSAAGKRIQRNSGLTAKSEFSFIKTTDGLKGSNTKLWVVVETRDGQMPVTDVSDASVTQT